ncbi:MAG: putative manganese-dependent inorganic diphosphatase [Romboutsia sp.]
MTLLVFGHKNPDTDSICSSISLSYLKNQLGEKATPYALGEIRKEAQYALNYFGVEAPQFLKDVKIQVKDLSYDTSSPLKSSNSILDAYKTMENTQVKTLPVVSDEGNFIGLVTMQEIAKNLINKHYYADNTCKDESSLVGDILCSDSIITFSENDYMDDIKDTMTSTNFRAYPVVNENDKFLGLISRIHLLNPTKKNVVLVDHNEYAQSADGIEQANIVEIVDHHKIGGIETDAPMSFRVMPVGCSCTVIYQLYKENNVEVPKHIAGLLLSAILSDTLLFKSPTTTSLDKKAGEELSQIADIDMEHYAMEMFKVATSLDEFSIEEIVNMDFKEFNMSRKRVGIGQVFTLDIDSIFAKKDEFLSYINSTDYDMLILAVTDIIKEGSYIIYNADDKLIAESFNVDAHQGVFAPGVVSRKKQLVPNLTNTIKNL